MEIQSSDSVIDATTFKVVGSIFALNVLIEKNVLECLLRSSIPCSNFVAFNFLFFLGVLLYVQYGA